jgi:predicted nucleotidyltransferase
MIRESGLKRFVPLDSPSADIATENEILRVRAGSEVYGTGSSSGGDMDQIGVFIEPPAYVLGFKKMETFTWRSQPEGHKSGPGDLDLTIHSLRKYISLAVRGNPTIIETLFVPDEFVDYSNQFGANIRKIRSTLISKEAYPRYRGYLQSQKERLKGEKKGHMPKRPELIYEFGYDTKYAMHAVRLGYQCIELLETGGIVLPVPEDPGDLLRGIRNGEYSFEQVVGEIEVLESLMEKAVEKSTIREKPAYDFIENWMINMHLDYWDMDRS